MTTRVILGDNHPRTRRLFSDRAEADRLSAPAMNSAGLQPEAVDLDLGLVHVSGECESRYRERFRPGLSYRDAPKGSASGCGRTGPSRSRRESGLGATPKLSVVSRWFLDGSMNG
jgi:hypothetical protein